ncbi:MAG: hypothetical protein V4720_00810, partial [Pseudomonadota bacterium]
QAIEIELVVPDQSIALKLSSCACTEAATRVIRTAGTAAIQIGSPLWFCLPKAAPPSQRSCKRRLTTLSAPDTIRDRQPDTGT